MVWPFDWQQRTLERSIGRAVLAEARSGVEDPRIPLSSPEAFAAIFGEWRSSINVTVTHESALSIAPFFGAVNFISSTFASLPAPVYTRSEKGSEKVPRTDTVQSLLQEWVNDEYLTSFQWRKTAMLNTLVKGRSFTFIEGKKRGRITNLWPLEPANMIVERVNGKKRYRYRDGDREVIYDPEEIIDIPFMLCADGLRHVDPVARLKECLSLCIALERYAASYFANGGVPPLALQMPAGTSPAAAKRATENIAGLVKQTREDKRLVLPMPMGHRLESVGFDPEHGQLIEARMQQLREIARIYSLPPMFLQDLEFGTYTNTEQQDLILVKHTLSQWLECWEQELNAKLFGPRSKNYVEFNVDGLLRGDFVSRMNAIAQGVQNAQITPNEGRDLENRPRSTQPEADMLHIQGATVPLGNSQNGGLDVLKGKFDAYGVGVRAGAISPQREDEEAFRKEAGFPPPSEKVAEVWTEEPVRRPITLTQDGKAPGPQGGNNAQEQ